MNSTTPFDIRQVIAIALGAISATIILHYMLSSLRYVVQGERLAADERIPLRHAIQVMSALVLALLGFLIWAPGFVRLAPCGVGLTLFIGISVWGNLKIRLHFTKKQMVGKDG